MAEPDCADACWYVDDDDIEQVARSAYRDAVGVDPGGVELRHRCGAALCVRPTHLQLPTRHEQEGRIRADYATGQWTPRALARRHGLSVLRVRKLLLRSAGADLETRLAAGAHRREQVTWVEEETAQGTAPTRADETAEPSG